MRVLENKGRAAFIHRKRLVYLQKSFGLDKTAENKVVSFNLKTLVMEEWEEKKSGEDGGMLEGGEELLDDEEEPSEGTLDQGDLMDDSYSL